MPKHAIAMHTPGPWEVLKPVTTWIQTAGNPYGRGSMHIADVRGWGHLTGRGGGCAFGEDKAVAIQEANAKLIAAAPELLAALTAIRWFCDNPNGSDGTDTLAMGLARLLPAARAAIAKAEGRA